MKRILMMAAVITVFLILPDRQALAHEPLFAIGPHVLFKGGFAPQITLFSGNGDAVETEYSLGYGITRNWTIIGETAFENDGSYQLNRLSLKQKYRFFSYFKPGLSREISAVANVAVPIRFGQPTVVEVGVTGGQEARRWYWFFAARYSMNFTNQDIKPGNMFRYSATLGYRPFNTGYYKPDLVIFLEGTGNFQQKSKQDNDIFTTSGGQTWEIAPTFVLTYRNVALRGGVQFGLADSGYIKAPKVNYKLAVELHL